MFSGIIFLLTRCWPGSVSSLSQDSHFITSSPVFFHPTPIYNRFMHFKLTWFIRGNFSLSFLPFCRVGNTATIVLKVSLLLLLRGHCSFFHWLTPPQANDRHLELAGQTEIFRKHPRKASILNMPLVTTLFYSCFYHYTEAEVQAHWTTPHTLTAQRNIVWSQCFDGFC